MVSAKTADFIGLSRCWQMQITCARKHSEPSQNSYFTAKSAGVFS